MSEWPICEDCETPHASTAACCYPCGCDSCENDRKALTDHEIALSHVSGALCDSGVVVPADELKYGEAVREIVAREKQLAGAFVEAKARIAALEAELAAVRADLERVTKDWVRDENTLVALVAEAEALVDHMQDSQTYPAEYAGTLRNLVCALSEGIDRSRGVAKLAEIAGEKT